MIQKMRGLFIGRLLSTAERKFLQDAACAASASCAAGKDGRGR